MLKNDIFWHAAYTKARREKNVSCLLDKSGIYNYLPLYKTMRIWSDRKKTVMLPLFPSYIFVKINKHQYDTVLNIPGIIRIIGFEDKPAIIPEWQIEAIKRIQEEDACIEVANIKPKPGDDLEVIKGKLKGLKGELFEYRGKKKIAVKLDAIETSIIINIPLNNIRVSKKIDQ